MDIVTLVSADYCWCAETWRRNACVQWTDEYWGLFPRELRKQWSWGDNWETDTKVYFWNEVNIYPFILLLHWCSRREYHALSRGFILQEVFRRVEPNKRTIGQFMKENVFSKLGVNVHIGLDMEGQNANKIANVEALSPTEVWKIISIV